MWLMAEVTPEGLLLRVVRRSRVSIEELLENLGPSGELDWGEPVGREGW